MEPWSQALFSLFLLRGRITPGRAVPTALLVEETRVRRDTVPAYSLQYPSIFLNLREPSKPAGWLMSHGRTVGRLCEPAQENK